MYFSYIAAGLIGGDVSTADAAGFTVPLAGGGAKGADKLG